MGTSRAVKAKVVYGLDGTLALATPETDFTTTPSIEIPASTLVPGRTYSYAVSVSEQDGAVSQSSTQTFVAKGYRLKLRILYRDGKPCKNKQVKLNSEPREGTTNDDGEVVFEDVEAGDHTVSFDVAGASVSQSVTVSANETVLADGVDLPLQSLELQIAQSSSSGKLPLLIGSTVGVVLVAAIGFVIMRQKRSLPIGRVNASAAVATQPLAPSADDDFLKPNPPAVSSVIHPEEHIETPQDKTPEQQG